VNAGKQCIERVTVSPDYRVPFAFSGTIQGVTIDVQK
jgi:hypothetical protein